MFAQIRNNHELSFKVVYVLQFAVSYNYSLSSTIHIFPQLYFY